MSDALKKEGIRSNKNKRLAHSLIFGEQTEQIAHFWWATWAICSHCPFLVSNQCDLLTSLIKTEKMSKSLVLKKTYKKSTKNKILVKFLWANCLFFVSERANKWIAQKTSGLLKKMRNWVIYHERWAIGSQSQGSERINHSCSFDLSNRSKWAVSEWANSQPCPYCSTNQIIASFLALTNQTARQLLVLSLLW